LGHRVIESAFDDPLDVLAVRRALPGNGERALAGRVHALGAVFLCAANDA
jgi:hypothetical protein